MTARALFDQCLDGSIRSGSSFDFLVAGSFPWYSAGARLPSAVGIQRAAPFRG
jgi:hypothetical protein